MSVNVCRYVRARRALPAIIQYRVEEVCMTNEERDIQRKLKVLQHTEQIGNARKAYRYFVIGRSSHLQ